jgi:hypothetical protein
MRSAMGIFPPVYPYEELEALNERQREILRDAVLHQIQTSTQIRRLLRRKTLPVYNQLISKKRKTRPRRKKK